MNENREIFVSACMMVKNEQANITRCLKSIKDVVDEIVIVDTGSEDKTVEIAESFGARVFHHPWEGDFSKHRNQSIDYARGQWIFIIDADEELVITRDVPDYPKQDALRRFLEVLDLSKERQDVGGVLLKDVQKGNVVMEFNSSRLFRKGHVHYEGIVHNAAMTTSRNAVLCEWMHLRHYGYDLTPEKKEEKYQRTNTLLRKRIEADPDDHVVNFYLCQLHADSGRDPQEAVKWGERYLEKREAILKTGENQFNSSIYFTLFRVHMHLGNTERAKQIIQEAINVFGGDLDIALAIVEYGVATEDPNVILEGCGGFLHTWDQWAKDPTAKKNNFVYSHRPEGLAFILFQKSLTHLIEGSKTVQTMMNVLSGLPSQMRDGYIYDLQTKLNEAGVPLELNFSKPDDPVNEINVVSNTIPQEAFL